MSSAELAAARDGTILADLSDAALLAVTGEDAATFLHNQFTNDVQALAVDSAQWNGWCSPKGRLLATFPLARWADGYRLLLPREIAEPVAKRLRMFVLRSKVKVEDVSAGHVLLGVAGPAAAAMAKALPPGARAIPLDGQRFVVVAPVDIAAQVHEAIVADGAVRAGLDAWQWRAVQAGIPVIVAATQDAFVPQMANYELVGGVSFKKGCYPGQEIVARTQYRGILKKRMALVHVAGGDRPAPGQDVYGETFGDQSAGNVVMAAPAPGGGFDALVVAQIEDLAKKSLRLGSPSGPALEIRSSPVETHPA